MGSFITGALCGIIIGGAISGICGCLYGQRTIQSAAIWAGVAEWRTDKSTYDPVFVWLSRDDTYTLCGDYVNDAMLTNEEKDLARGRTKRATEDASGESS